VKVFFRKRAQFNADRKGEPGTLMVQQRALLETEGLCIDLEPGSIDAMAEVAAEAYSRMENIGVRGLMTIIERVFEEISFDAPEMAARGETAVPITVEFVRARPKPVMKDEDLSRFVL
jgi:ATP-dependent HslUV protease ATP-binding subunit HslU